MAKHTQDIIVGSQTHIDLRNCSLSPDMIKPIAEHLVGRPDVTSIDLSGNSINDTGAEEIAETLRGNHSITFIDLCMNQISDKGAAKILEAIRANPNITFIGLIGNKISLGIEESINVAIEDNQSIQSMKREFAEDAGDWHQQSHINLQSLIIESRNQLRLEIEASLKEAREDNQSMVKGLADFIKSEYFLSPFSPFTWYFLPNHLDWHFNTEKYKLFQVCDKELLGRHLVQLGFPQEGIQELFALVTTVITSNIESLYNSRISVPLDDKVDIHPIINSYLGPDSLWPPLQVGKLVQEIDADMIGLDGLMDSPSSLQ